MQKRNFSARKEESADDIFQSADYFENTAKTAVETVEQSREIVPLPWTDMNDSLGTFQSLLAKDPSNLVIGKATYGPWEYISYLDTAFYDLWLLCAEQQGLGLGLGMGLIISSMITKVMFAPAIMYSQVVGVKMRLLQPDSDEMQAAMKRYQQQGVSLSKLTGVLEQGSNQDGTTKVKAYAKDSWHLSYVFDVKHLSAPSAFGLYLHD